MSDTKKNKMRRARGNAKARPMELSPLAVEEIERRRIIAEAERLAQCGPVRHFTREEIAAENARRNQEKEPKK